MLESALRYPTKTDDPLRLHLIGGALSLLSFLILPIFIVHGYQLRTLGHRSRGHTDLPAFDDWESLLITGLKGMVVTIGYGLLFFLPIGALAAVTVGPAVLLGFEGLAISLAGITFIVFAVLTSLALTYTLPAAYITMVRNDSLQAAFSYGNLAPALFNREYATAALFAILVNILISIVGMLLWVTIIGGILTPVLQFYSMLVLAGLFGHGYHRAITDDDNDDDEGDAADGTDTTVA